MTFNEKEVEAQSLRIQEALAEIDGDSKQAEIARIKAVNAALKQENEVLREYAAMLDYWFNPGKVPVNAKRIIGALRVKCASLLTAEESG